MACLSIWNPQASMVHRHFLIFASPCSHDVITHQELSDEEALAKAEFGMPRGVREVEAMVRRAETNEDIARMKRLPANDHHLNGLK